MQAAIDQRIQEYYGTEFDEDARLDRPAGRLEMIRVKELLGPRLPANSTIADIGGGTGVHARWLVAEGHQVVLVDPVRRHVELANRVPGVTAMVGDARKLELATDSCDAALLFGPLYHLESRRDRVTALREARRVVKPGGLVFVAVIPRWAVYSDSMTTLPDAAPVPTELHTIMDTGQSHARAHFPGAHFHTSAELAAELEQAGLEVLQLIGIEGPGGLPLEFLPDVSDEVIDAALTLARHVAHLEGPREMSGHLLGIAQVG